MVECVTLIIWFGGEPFEQIPSKILFSDEPTLTRITLITIKSSEWDFAGYLLEKKPFGRGNRSRSNHCNLKILWLSELFSKGWFIREWDFAGYSLEKNP